MQRRVFIFYAGDMIILKFEVEPDFGRFLHFFETDAHLLTRTKIDVIVFVV
jgi:hypothetical protein